MKKSNTSLIRRGIWYTLGLILFYAPFALYQKGLLLILKNGNGREQDWHALCLRMPLLSLFSGKGLQILTIGGISILLLFLSAFIFGPFFCGRLCFAGALPEYLSRIVPDRFKINWYKAINPAPVRYGFLAGFVIAPFVSGSIVCSLCNYSFAQRLLTGGLWGELGYLGSTTILTAFLWLILFGVFSKGGRGYCNFLCPIGAVQNLIYSIGVKLPFTYKLRLSKGKCASCGICVKECPMGSLQNSKEGITYQIHNCITCHQCKAVCPKGAISYSTGKGLWNEIPNKQAEIENRVIENKI